jgi:hypothetical protein
MDREQGKGKRWDWLPQHMPGVAKLLAEKRIEFGDAHVNQCWKRGVIEKQPGWFFAREGAIAVGTAWPAGDPMAGVASWQLTATQATLIIRDPEVVHGAN